MKNTVLYIGNFSFPLGNAAGKRVYANGKMLKELGYEVLFIGMSKENVAIKSLKTTKKEYEGFTYYNFSYPNTSIDWVNYKKTFCELRRFLEEEEIINDLFLVIYYGSPAISLFNIRLIRFCREKKVKVIADCVDWLTTKTRNPLFDIIKWLDNTYQKSYANKKTDGVIAISSYLSNYYEKAGNMTVIIPPLSPIDYHISELNINRSYEKIITYAGLPFRKGQIVTDCNSLKDRIDKTIILLHEAKKRNCKFVLNIYGFTKGEYLHAIPEQKKYVEDLGTHIVFHGNKSNEEVVESVKNSDFTILIRDINRDTTAGFPTKVSESISCGTPVITTKTSDLEKYIIDGKNGFFINIDDKEKALLYLKKILEMNKEEIKLMKKNCVESQLFYYRNYIKHIKDFLSKL